jgi:endonuclease-8
MPEGHSVHRIARRFDALFVGQRPTLTSPQGRFTEGAAILSGRTLLESRAVGKQLFLAFEDDAWMRVHLGIYGAWDFIQNTSLAERASHSDTVDEDGEDSLLSIGAPRKTRLRIAEQELELDDEEVFPPPPRGQVRVRMLTDDALADLRGPTACEVLDFAQITSVLNRLGPDPASEQSAAAGKRFIEVAAKKKTPIGLVLMDQAVIAGIGNVYRAELLFRAGINPHTPTNSLTNAQLLALWDDWAYLLNIGIEVGQMITRDGLSPKEYSAALRQRASRHWVYKREGLPCLRCGTNIALEMMANRKLYWCPGCQHG